MGKKKDRSVLGSSKRRTVLQIEGPSLSSRKGYGQNSTSNALSGLMAHYGDSDEEPEPSPPQYASFQQVEAQDQGKPPTEMDAKLADFLAEIDAMDTASNSPTGLGDSGKATDSAEGIDGQPIDPEDYPNTEGPGVQAEPAAAGAEFVGGDNSNLGAAGGWQELLDENTNCVYYWNTDTNEVTWEMPEAFTLQQQATSSATIQPAEADSSDAGGTEKTQASGTLGVLQNYGTETYNGDIDGDNVQLGGPNHESPDTDADQMPERAEEEIKKLPVYGSENVNYSIDPVPDELAEIVKDDLKGDDEEVDDHDDHDDDNVVIKEASTKSNLYSAFAKGPILPGSADDTKGKNGHTEDEMDHDDLDDEEEDNESDDGRYDLCNDTPKLSPDPKKVEKDELYSIDMFADDVDDIDQQLEMALEKKKAELKELQEAELSTSPPTSQTDKDKKRKAESDLAHIYDESGEVDLSKFKKKRLENLAGKNKLAAAAAAAAAAAQAVHGSTQDVGTQCDLEQELSPEEKSKVRDKQKVKEEAERKPRIVDLVSVITSKLEFLGITDKGLNKFQVLLIEMQTRIQDWRDGVLDSKHLVQKLELADWELQRYENDAAPHGWLCSWDRTHKQYYYTNMLTNESQWEYPLEAAALEAETGDMTTVEETRNAFSNAADRGYDQESSDDESMDEDNDEEEAPAAPKSSKSEAPPDLPPSQPPPVPSEERASPLPAPPLPDGPPPPPGLEPELPPLPSSPPPGTPPPPAPSDEEDAERPLTPPPFLAPLSGTDFYSLQPPPPPNGDAMDTATSNSNSSTVIGKPQVLYSAPAVTGGAPTIAAAPVITAQAAPTKAQPVAPPSRTSKVKKKKKESKKTKNKLPLSLVEKWKQIKEEQEKAMEESESSEEEDITVRNQKMIAEWKKDQIIKGKAAYNANFEQIQGDWRERLKRKSKSKK